MSTRMGDFQDNNKTTVAAAYPQTKHAVCTNCGCAENSDKSSSALSCSTNSSVTDSNSTTSPTTPKSPHRVFAHDNNNIINTNNNSNSRDRRPNNNNNNRLVSRRSESCTDLNGNSRTKLLHSPTSTSSSSRRAPSLAALSRNVTAVRPFSMSLDAATPRGSTRNHEKIHESRECGKESPVLYLTPLQRKEREGKEMKKEISRLYMELSHKDERIYQLQIQLEEQLKDYQYELDRKIVEIQDLMEDKENVVEASRQEKISLDEELAKMDQMFTELKVKHKLQEDQFQERYLDMYKRGQKAAMFEREQELEMIATCKQPKVTVRELTRKLSITESELAKWQSYRLDETYKSADKPLTDADVTLAFLKDSFYHFVCDREDCLRHFRAIVEIFRYSDPQMGKIRKTISDSKDFRNLFKKDIG